MRGGGRRGTEGGGVGEGRYIGEGKKVWCHTFGEREKSSRKGI